MSAATYESIQPLSELPFCRTYDDGESVFEIRVDAQFNTHVVVSGRGTLEGARALLSGLDDALALFDSKLRSKVYVDLSANRGGPLRGQFMFGKWLMRHRNRIERGVIVGARQLDRRLAKGAMRVARLKNVRFYEGEAEARAWLNER